MCQEIDIDGIIKKSSFNKYDIEDATCGLCGTFALVLYRFCKKHETKAQLVAFAEKDRYKWLKKDWEIDPSQREKIGKLYGMGDGDKPLFIYWSHIAVEIFGEYYDIRGKVFPKEIHDEFYTNSIIPITEVQLLRELRFLTHYSHRKYHDWQSRLKGNSLRT